MFPGEGRVFIEQELGRHRPEVDQFEPEPRLVPVHQGGCLHDLPQVKVIEAGQGCQHLRPVGGRNGAGSGGHVDVDLVLTAQRHQELGLVQADLT